MASLIKILVCLTAIACSGKTSTPSRNSVILATTTSTFDSGLLDNIIPNFEKETGLKVKTIAVGTGQAIELGKRGEADLLLVHAPAVEKEFINKGYGKNRRPVMHNDFVIVGPKDDQAGILGMKDVTLALFTIYKHRAKWLSRGDRSGTHYKEKHLWTQAGIAPAGDWFMESGQGMGATLRIANEKDAYTLSDRGTFLSVKNLSLTVLVQGDPRLFNPYHVIEVAGVKVNAEGAKKLADFLVAESTQKKIGDFKSQGFKLFTPDAPAGSQK